MEAVELSPLDDNEEAIGGLGKGDWVRSPQRRVEGGRRLLNFMRRDTTGGGGGGGGKDRGQMVGGRRWGRWRQETSRGGACEDRPGACANCVAGPLDKTVEGVTALALALAARNKWRWSLKTGRACMHKHGTHGREECEGKNLYHSVLLR